MAQQIQLRNGTAAEWTAANPVLAKGELGVENDTFAYKFGDGVTSWNDIAYRQMGGEFQSLIMNELLADPSTPSATKLTIYSKSIGGRLMPKWKGPSGLDTPIQPAIFSNSIQCLSPGAATALSAFGTGTPTAVGTLSHPNIAPGSIRTAARRGSVVSAATANSVAELRITTPQCYRGETVSGLNIGGFFFSQRFACVSTTASQRAAFGLFSTTAAISTTQNPSALTNCIFAGWDSADTNLQIMSNDASGLCNKVDLGSNFPANTNTAVFDIVFFSPPGQDKVMWRAARLDVDVPSVSGEISAANLPATTTLLSWHAYMNNGGTAASVNFDIMRLYIESDV